MSLKREEKHFPILIAICFLGNFILGGVGQIFPLGSFAQKFAWQWSGLLFMAGTSLYAAKLHTEKWHISSAGFIMLSIGQGIIFTMPNSFSEESQALFATAILTFLPGMFFICYYSGFPTWLRILGLISILPFLIIMIEIDMHTYNIYKEQWFSAAGFVMLQIVSICWAYFVFRPYKQTVEQD